jgi:hypothetical protein
MGTDSAALCRIGLKLVDMHVCINTVMKNICRAGKATCMKRALQDDMNAPQQKPARACRTAFEREVEPGSSCVVHRLEKPGCDGT